MNFWTGLKETFANFQNRNNVYIWSLNIRIEPFLTERGELYVRISQNDGSYNTREIKIRAEQFAVFKSELEKVTLE